MFGFNPTFNPNNNESVIAAIEKGFALKNTDSPQQNYDYAVQNWNTKAIAKKHIAVYKEVLNI